MSTIVKYQFSEDELKKIKESYDNIKNKLPPTITNFTEYLNYFVETAIATHIQFISLNGSISEMFDSKNLDLSNINMDDIGDFMNGLFNDKSNNDIKKSSPKTSSKKKN
ncbi:MAG: hypothetical protein ACRC4L_02545 [Mycoplasma sp.]